MKIFFVLSLLVCLCLCKENVNSIIQSLPGKYCPMRGLNGQSFCPNSGKKILDEALLPFLVDKNNLPEGTPLLFPEDNSNVEVSGFEEFASKMNKINTPPKSPYKTTAVPRIISGFGFDRVNREMKFPVYPSKAAGVSVHHEHRVKQFNNVAEFMNYILAPHARVEAGIYARDINYLKSIAKSFGDSTAKLGMTQKIHRTHSTSISSATALPEFTNAINSLPAYNKNDPHSKTMYRMIIRFWGTNIATTVNHGGSVYQQTIIKRCFGGNVNEGMINDIESRINQRTPGSGYLRYRKLGIFEARGGNPEFGASKIKERIASFASAPAPLEWDSIPLYNAVTDTKKRAWLKSAIDDYVAENKHTADSIIREVQQNELNHYKRRQNIYIADFNVEHGGSITLRWTGCPVVQLRSSSYCPWCTLLRPVAALAAGQTYTSPVVGVKGTQAIVERHGPTGHARIRMITTRDGATKFQSPFIRTGCTWVNQYGYLCRGRNCVSIHPLLYRAFCIDCLPHLVQSRAHHNQVHTKLTCVCPTF